VRAIASHVPKEEIRSMGEIGIGSYYHNQTNTQYRKAGMTIGSGAIESVHKWVIQARCKQAGMVWSEQGVNAILRLRCVWASGRLGAGMKFLHYPKVPMAKSSAIQ
jgi:hypothetical protein